MIHQDFKITNIAAGILLFSLLFLFHLSLPQPVLASDNPDSCFNSAITTRGNANGDQVINITDAIVILNFLFRGGPVPACKTNADADGSGTLELSDAVHILFFLFQGELPPVDRKLTDFDFGPPLLVPLSPQETATVTINFKSNKDFITLPFYPANIHTDSLVDCHVTATPETGGATIDIFDAKLDEFSEWSQLGHLFYYGHPLIEGRYVIKSTCTSELGEGIAEAKLIIEKDPNFVDVNPPPPILCRDGIDRCCQDVKWGNYYCAVDLNDDPNIEPNPKCNVHQDGTPDIDTNNVSLCNNPGAGGADGGGATYEPTKTPTPPKGYCKVKCVTIIQGSSGTAQCKDNLITFTVPGQTSTPLERFKKEYGEEIGRNYVDTKSSWPQGIPGLGVNQGQTTKFKKDDPNIKDEAEGRERVGYGFVVAATYEGVDDKGNTIQEVNPKKCREYQFVKSTQYQGIKESRYVAIHPRDDLLVSGQQSKSLLKWDEEGPLESLKTIVDKKNARADSTTNRLNGCPDNDNRFCADDSYRKIDGDDENREMTGMDYDPNTGGQWKRFVKRFDLEPEDGVKKLFWADNPSLFITKEQRKVLNIGQLQKFEMKDNFLMIGEDESGNHKIECRLEGLILTVEKGEQVDTSKKTVTPPSNCECTEWQKGDKDWQQVGIPWGC